MNIYRSILKLDSWLQSMRTNSGYTGPICHWWDSSFIYCGVGIDWRYEGIILGYVDLFKRTNDYLWLNRALMAGNDVIKNQLNSKNFLNSSFQYGPFEGGTPHEASVDVALLELAKLLKENDNPIWKSYFKAAEDNIQEYLIGKLWNLKGFMEQPWDSTLVPNKNATTIEALILYSELSGKDVSKFVLNAADVVINNQILEDGRFGGTVHTGTGPHQLSIGIYTARCISGISRLYDLTQNEKYLKFIDYAAIYLQNLIFNNKIFFGHYKNNHLIKSPQFISPSGDILRALLIAKTHGISVNNTKISMLIDTLLINQDEAGGFRTAHGFSHKGSTKEYTGLPEFRDILPVVGWNDKILRAFSMLVDNKNKSEKTEVGISEMTCLWKGKICIYTENSRKIELRRIRNNKILYKWNKGENVPQIYNL
jgi:hypothetical protein